MPQLVIKHSETEREVIYDASNVEEQPTKPYVYIHMMPVEIERIKNAKTEDVQNILRRYI